MLRYLAILALLLCAAFSACAQEQAVVPITKLQFLGVATVAKFGSGFCLDLECRYIVTNYHVAKAMGKNFSIQHESVVERWLATGPNDDGATKDGYNPAHDLAVVELRHSLQHKGYHGLTYSTNLAEGEDVDIYSYPLEFNPKRKLLHFHGKFIGNSTIGLLLFSYEPNPQHIKGGASGGMIVDSKGRVVAVLADVITNQKNVIGGVSVEMLSAFVGKIQPYMAAQLFPKSVFIPPVAVDYYPEWLPPPSDGTLQRRQPESPDIKLLREKAQGVVSNMFTMVAVESFEWGKDANDPAAVGSYEVRMIDGYQHFREYPDGKKERDDVIWPPTNHAVAPGNAWFATPEVVAEDYDLKIHRADDIVWKGQALRVFQYLGAKEDKFCNFDEQTDLGFLVIHNVQAYACYGEVWTDQDNNIVRVSENFHMPGNYREVVTYGWVEIEGDRSLVPLTVSSQAEYSAHVYWCRGIFTNYQQFKTKVRFFSADPQK